MKKLFRLIIYAFFLVIGMIFCVSNRGKIELTLFPLPYAMTLPAFVFAITILIVGMLLGWMFTRFKLVRMAGEHKNARKRIAALENELTALRSEQLLKTPAPLPVK